MSETVACDIHGDRECTVVCVHITETLRDGQPRGFFWSIDEDGEYQATCSSCSDMDDATWEASAVELGRVLCLDCYRRAAGLNDVSLERPH